MGHRVPPMVEIGRGKCIFARAPGVKHKARLKWRRGSRFQKTQFAAASSRGCNLCAQKYRGHPPEAPRNTTSYIIHSKSMGDAIAPVVTPSPFTPAILLTPEPLPRYKDQFAEEAKQWGVNGYGSMSGLIRMKATDKRDGVKVGGGDDRETEEEAGEQNGHNARSLQQLEQRLDQGLLNRFEIIYPCNPGCRQSPPLQVLLVDQEHHIFELEEENLTLRERVSFIERELVDLRSRIHMLEGGSDHLESGEVVSEKSIGTTHLKSK